MQVALVLIILQLHIVKHASRAFRSPSLPFRYISPNSVNGIRQKSSLCMVLPPPLDKLERDFKALTRRVTAYHILLPKSTDAALTLKQNIRNRVNTPKSRSESKTDDDNDDSDDDDARQGMYIVDAFSQAARRYSLDDDTKGDGGLLGTMLPQGAYNNCPELDKALWEVAMGDVAGPIESEFGYHLVLVEERTNCPNLDGPYSKIARGGDGTEAVFVRPNGKEEGSDFLGLAVEQLGLWVGIVVAGGILAEVAQGVADALNK